ncbi:arginine--tRNA ligase 1 [Planctomycetota bacterium]|nr:arginine--tRNA ligase 1 [Planctomycetota bacterium]
MLDLLVAPLATAVAARLGRLPGEIAPLIGPPAKGQGADLALPCFQLAKSANRNSAQLAADLATLEVPGMALSAAGPFLNAALQPATVAGVLLPVLAGDPLLCLRRDHGEGKTVCIDFSSPNIAKHLAFHHIRSTMIGNALARLYGACGWRVVRINFLGDWGTAFGRLISAWHREGLTLAQLDAAPDRVTFLNELYVRASQAEKADPAKEADSRRWSKALEDGDAEARHLWQIFKDASLAEFQRIYALLGVGFDSWKGEAFYEDKMGAVLAELESRGLTKVDQGATVVDLSALGLKKPMLLRRADGGSLYATRDLAACDDRWKDYAFDRSLYVVDLGQALHFKEWFACAALLGRAYADRLRHIGFGIVLLWNDEPGEGLEPGWARGRTRGGKVMLLREVLEESVDRARAVIAEKNPGIEGDERERIARAVGVGAVVFNDLKNARTNDVKFKFEEALRFDGETGPYLQFAHARLCSIERKFREAFPQAPAGDPARIARDDEKAVLIAIARLGSALDRAVESDEPSQLAQGLLALAAAVSAWLTAGSKDDTARVLVEDAALAASRLRLVRAARAALGEGLRLLGLEAPERM